MNNQPKLHAYLAHLGLASRRKAEEMIAQGRVWVNNQRATVGDRVTPGQDKIEVDGKNVSQRQTEPLTYYLVNKPIGYISTADDELGRKTVLSLIPASKERLYPVGRLDKDSEGLMLLTNDGDLAYRMTHPRFEIDKLYKVLINAEPTEKALDFIRRGVKLGSTFTKPAEVELVNVVDEGAWLEIKIHEGKQHQVRRMLERAGYDTVRLIRLQMGPLTLKDLHGKRFQKLTDEQVMRLKKAIGLN
ncbi:MAG TPA: pseudouridine synthase [Vitreimonas sp.]|nr:pseudouridine synthase [Vitreimonas sp.]